MLVDQQAHELGDGDCRMRVIQLDGSFLGEIEQAAVLIDMAPEQILQRGRGEEILLAQAQLLARRRGIRRIENPRDAFGLCRIHLRADMVALVELVELDGVHRPCIPQAKRVDALSLPAADRRIERHGQDFFRRLPLVMGHAVKLGRGFNRSAEADFKFPLAPFEFPRIAVNQPILRQLDLHSVDDFLPEQPVAIADAITKGRNAKACHAFHEAGRKPPQSAIAQCCVRFQRLDQISLDAKILERRLERVEQPEIRTPHRAKAAR